LVPGKEVTAGRSLISGAPKIFESFLAQFGVAGGVLDGAMAEPVSWISRGSFYRNWHNSRHNRHKCLRSSHSHTHDA
jgi:hypothetical protein